MGYRKFSLSGKRAFMEDTLSAIMSFYFLRGTGRWRLKPRLGANATKPACAG